MRVEPLKDAFNARFELISTDKSISHRCAIFSLLSGETSVIKDYLEAGDTLNSLKIIEALGAKVEKINGAYHIKPPKKIISPNRVLDCGNSGTAMRIFMGLLSSVENGFFVLSGDVYLNERPMKRVAAPLSQIGAKIYGRDGGNKAPLAINGANLDYFEFKSTIASAQIKTALILAGLLGQGCEFSEPELSRDHSEKMLISMGADIRREGLNLIIKPLNGKKLRPLNLSVPNDPSSCFFYAVAAAIVPGAKIMITNMLLNKTRIEAFKVLEKMGAKITYKIDEKNIFDEVGDIIVENAPLSAVEVSENISWLIDEAPALAIAFACANGKSVLKNAKELRVKESDRIAVMVSNLKKFGIKAVEREDGFEIEGSEFGREWLGNLESGFDEDFVEIDSHGDHRIAMSFAILGLLKGVEIEGSEFIATSFPKFSEFLRKLGAQIED